ALVLTVLFCSAAFADNLIHVVVYGDSLTSGFQLQQDEAFPAKLGAKFRQVGFTNVRVTNMGSPDATTASGLEHIDTLLATHPDVVVLELGYNDAQRGISPSIIFTNLANIIRNLQQYKSEVVLLGVRAPVSMGSNYAAQLEADYTSLAKSYSIALYPSILDGLIGRADMNQADGIHPS